MFINISAGVILTNGNVWNIRKLMRFGDAFMILDEKTLKFSGYILIDKVDVGYGE